MVIGQNERLWFDPKTHKLRTIKHIPGNYWLTFCILNVSVAPKPFRTDKK